MMVMSPLNLSPHARVRSAVDSWFEQKGWKVTQVLSSGKTDVATRTEPRLALPPRLAQHPPLYPCVASLLSHNPPVMPHENPAHF